MLRELFAHEACIRNIIVLAQETKNMEVKLLRKMSLHVVQLKEAV